jgi:hypothetical protein
MKPSQGENWFGAFWCSRNNDEHQPRSVNIVVFDRLYNLMFVGGCLTLHYAVQDKRKCSSRKKLHKMLLQLLDQ